MKKIDKKSLPVHWRANKKAWMTGFIPEVEPYLKFKVLLLLDNSLGHPKYFNHPNLKVIFDQSSIN
jgi:hypothetical protein